MEVVTKSKGAFEKLPAARQHDHNLVEELIKRTGALWHYGECVLDAEGDPDVQQIWRDLQSQELVAIQQLRQLIADQIEKGELLEDL